MSIIIIHEIGTPSLTVNFDCWSQADKIMRRPLYFYLVYLKCVGLLFIWQGLTFIFLHLLSSGSFVCLKFNRHKWTLCWYCLFWKSPFYKYKSRLFNFDFKYSFIESNPKTYTFSSFLRKVFRYCFSDFIFLPIHVKMKSTRLR